MTIELEHVNFSYVTEAPVLLDLSLQIREGESVLLAGHNGAGKSTFLKLLNGLLRPTSGTVNVAGKNTQTTATSELARHVAVTFQNPGDQIFAPTVWKEISFGPKNLRRTNAEELVSESLKLFGLNDKLDRHPYDLSPAGRKLLTVASAVASAAPFLAFDEPTAGLSQSERSILINAIRNLLSQNRTLIIVSHDLEFFLPRCSKTVLLAHGRVTYIGETLELLEREQFLRQAGLRLPATVRLKKLIAQARMKR